MLMSITDAATHLNVSSNTIRRRLQVGLLTGSKVGRKWMINVNGQGGEVAPPEPGEDNGQQSEVTWLREQLEARTREIAELHQLLAAHSLNAGQRKSWWAFWR